MDNKVKEMYLQRLVERAIDHCIAVDYDFIVANYDNWDEYLMEIFGTNYEELKSVGITLEDLWNK